MKVTGNLSIRNNKYQMQVYYINQATGKRKSISKTTGIEARGRKKKAKVMLEEMMAEVEKSLIDADRRNTATSLLSGEDMAFVDFLDAWLEMAKLSIARSTYAGYRNNLKIIKNYFRPLKLALSQVKAVHIQEFYSNKLSQGKKAATIIRYHANIRKALEEAVKLELIHSNPADKVNLPKKEVFVGCFYSADEVKRLFEAFEGDVCELCIHIATFYGLRRSEIIGLTWDSIDFSSKKIEIRNKITKALDENGKYQLIEEKTLKNNSSRRTLPLIPKIEEMLLAEKKKQGQNKLLCGNSYDNTHDGYICRKPTGELIKPNYLTDHFDRIIKKHKLRHIRLHDLRHTYASAMLANGVSLKQIQEWLGHSSFGTTANVYSHLDYSSKQHSASVIGSVYG